MLECAIHPITYSGEGILATVVKISVGIHTGTINGICNKSLQNFRNKMICLNNMPYILLPGVNNTHTSILRCQSHTGTIIPINSHMFHWAFQCLYWILHLF